VNTTVNTSKLAIKAVTTTGCAPIHGTAEYDLPTQNADGSWTPGAWHRVGPGEIAYRGHGVHVCQPSQYRYWATLLRRVRPGLRVKVWVVEYRGQVSVGANGFAVRECRLVRPYVKGEVL
jgi:hypothetical protein